MTIMIVVREHSVLIHGFMHSYHGKDRCFFLIILYSVLMLQWTTENQEGL